MKKVFLILAICLAAYGISYAQEATQAVKDRVYIGASLSMSFEDFYYNSFKDNATTSEGNDNKLMSGPRYDFTAGYRLTKNFRAEAQYIIISNNSFETDNTDGKVEYKATGVFANLIYDFWNFQEHFITPFIGFGAGVGSPNLNVSYNGIKNEVDESNFSWQVQGGVNVKLLDWLIVNVKYTYISMPGLEKRLDDEKNPDVDYFETELKQGVQAIGLGVTLLL